MILRCVQGNLLIHADTRVYSLTEVCSVTLEFVWAGNEVYIGCT